MNCNRRRFRQLFFILLTIDASLAFFVSICMGAQPLTEPNDYLEHPCSPGFSGSAGRGLFGCGRGRFTGNHAESFGFSRYSGG